VPRIRIVSNRPGLDPVVCLVAEYSDYELLRAARCEGSYDVSDPDNAKLLMINPLDGHWSLAVDYDSAMEEIRCMPIEGDPDLPWWQRVVGAGSVTPRSASNIKIGIIDILYDAPAELQHVIFVDPIEWKQSVRK
jgi:hypothetical protein